jgi:two-component system, NarL family, nitrate/nitrite response regulator NarL
MGEGEAARRGGTPIRVLIVDDHLSVLWGLERLIESADHAMVLVGKATDAAEALIQGTLARPDVILLDLALQDEDATKIIPELIDNSGARVLVLTAERSDAVRDKAMLAGASGVVGKEEPPANILRAIAKVHEGELWLDRSSVGRIFNQLSHDARSPPESAAASRFMRLTPRERQIARLVAGQPSQSLKMLAATQHISESTLRNHLTSIYAKLDVTSRLELYVYVSEHAPED